MTLERRVTEDDGTARTILCDHRDHRSVPRKVPKMASSKLKNLSFVLCLLLLGLAGPTTAQESCSARGCGDLDFDFDCQCNADCFYYENCCGDYVEECGSTCQGRCGDYADSDDIPCQCNSGCVDFGDCCGDYDDVCDGTCQGKCGDYDSSASCQCNSGCLDFGDCCGDYTEVCGDVPDPDGSCSERCGNAADPDTVYTSFDCYCDAQCDRFGDCCPDFDQCGLDDEQCPQSDSDCVISLDACSNYPRYSPILTDSQGEFVYPTGDFYERTRTIGLSVGDSIDLSCSNVGFINGEVDDDDFATATCASGGLFEVNGDQFDFGDLGCNTQPEDEAVETTRTCGPNSEGVEVELGFSTEDGFSPTVTVCFDQDRSNSLYAYHFLPLEMSSRDHGNERPLFEPGDFYPFDVDYYYGRDRQRDTIADLVGSQDLAEEYVEDSGDVYLVRGHLTPNADFVYYSFQDSTFYFINVAPQWQSFNGGNWVDIENAVRALNVDQGRELMVYTGTSGVALLDDEEGDKVEIYLYPYGDGGDRLPVPKFYWKLVHYVDDDTAIGLVGVNNPHIGESEASSSEYRICPEVEGHILLSEVEDVDDIYLGVVYACTYDDLREAFPEVPDIGDPGILF